jgi:hypothetical protein
MPYFRSHPYNHTQTVASTTWTIIHNGGCHPAVDVSINYNGNLTKILPLNIRNVDLNTIEITFSSPQTGEARLV